MNKPSGNPILVAAASLFLSSCALDKSPKPIDKPAPPVPAEIRAKGGDDVVKWLLDGGYLKPDDLCGFIRDKARQAACGEEIDKDSDENPLSAKLRSGYESLPASAFKVGVKPKWNMVAAKLTPEVLAKANRLEDPKIYGVNSEGQLLIGDGGSEVPSFTLRQNYFEARNTAKSQGLSLMTEGEYRAFNIGTMEVEGWTWLESGEAPALALDGRWRGSVIVRGDRPKRGYDHGGARRVIRVKIFEF